MTRVVLLAFLISLAVAILVYEHFSGETLPVKGLVAIPEAAPPCPWRDAETDMTNWFPGATGYSIADQILSGKRLELQKRLGRPLFPEENALHVYVVASNAAPLGIVLTRRLKGTGGALEIALGLDRQNKIQAFKIQRLREPEEIVESLDSLKLDKRLRGMCVENDFATIEVDSGSPLAKSVGTNILEGVRSLLVLNDTAGTNRLSSHH